MSFSIRLAEPRDDAAIGELLVSAFVDTYAVKMPEVVPTPRRQAELRDVAAKRAIARVFVAESDEGIVGTIALWPPGASGSQAFVSGACDLRHLALGPSLRGKGGAVSSMLVTAVEEEARRIGSPAICLHVRRGALGLYRFYERHGYVRAPDGDLDLLPEVFLLGYVKQF